LADEEPQARGQSAEDTLAMFRMGLDIHRSGRLAEAEAIYGEVLRRSPDTPDALHLLGLIRLQTGKADQACELIARAIALKPGDAAMRVNHGNALMAAGRPAEAVAAFEAAQALDGSLGGLHRLRADALQTLGRWDEAVSAYDQALALLPDDPVLHFNRANQLRYLRRIGEATEAYGAALARDPDFAVAHHNRAVCRLLAGDWAGGLEDYEWRRACPTFTDPRYRLTPDWTGAEDLSGRSLFVFAELFLGDVIQMSRYLPLAAERGARVILAAPASLHRLLSTLPAHVELLAADAQPGRFDYVCPLMSLPHAFRTRPNTVPAAIPYLQAEPDRAKRWAERIGGHGFRIGVCWQGSTAAYALPMQRSFPLAALAPLAARPGVRLISLQKHDGLDQLADLPAGMAVGTLGDFDVGTDAFLDTAAVMQACDLVITADTAIAHLAGALGVRTWTGLPFVPDWRWGLEGETTPWYPSMRLFRQPRAGDWESVIARMTEDLAREGRDA
jgi:tetratricopeptide (TPR) repeat protein